MVKRIVKMTFREEECAAFEQLFGEFRQHIRSAPGCMSLELLRARDPSSVYFTYSSWENAESLEAYRNSGVFAEVWPRTRAMFAAPAEAWTVDVLHDL
jgi:quinol monooxygenase YgiN